MKKPTCPYCKVPARFFASSAKFYNGRDYGPVYACEPCGAWVGCHKGTHNALGRLANKELRAAKQLAHGAFDRLWQAKIRKEGLSKGRARKAGYTWLAIQMGIEVHRCHIGWMDLEECRRVVELCAPYHAENRAA